MILFNQRILGGRKCDNYRFYQLPISSDSISSFIYKELGVQGSEAISGKAEFRIQFS